MEQYLLYLVLGLLGLLTVFWLLNLLMVKTKNTTSIFLSRGVYICGILCVIINIFRIFVTYEVNLGAHLVSNIIVLISIVVAFARSENKSDDKEEY